MNQIMKEIKRIINRSLPTDETIVTGRDYVSYHYLNKGTQTDLEIYLVLKKINNKEYIFTPVRYQVNYNEFDNILNEVLIQTGLLPKVTDDNRLPSFFIHQETNIELPVTESIIFEFKEQFQQNILPFFDRWSDINRLYEYISNVRDNAEIKEILGPYSEFKKAAILCLCHDEGYDAYIDALVKTKKDFFEKTPNESNAEKYYKAACILKEVLDDAKTTYKNA